MNLRLRFLTDWQAGCWTMTEVCTDDQISRKTGYTWVDRYDAAGGPARASRSVAATPSQPPHDRSGGGRGLGRAAEAAPALGPRKLLAIAATQPPRAVWPSRSTTAALVRQRGLVASRRRTARPGRVPAPLAPITATNEVWTTDFKGEFRTGDGVYCYPLTLRDGFSRFVLRCDAWRGPTYLDTRQRFARAFADDGLPERIRSDNGGPFASTGLGGLSRLSVWWMRLGIVPERIARGRPDQNGSHEQFHSVLKAETARPPAPHARAQQRRFGRFCHEYNQERPHEALGDEVPASCYQPSPRPLPRHPPPLDYPAHLEVRRTSVNGSISWRGRAVFVSEALAGEDVAFEEVDDGLWTIRFAAITLGRFDERHHRIAPVGPVTRGRSAGGARSAPDVNSQ